MAPDAPELPERNPAAFLVALTLRSPQMGDEEQTNPRLLHKGAGGS
jgi:hypothetical protein